MRIVRSLAALALAGQWREPEQVRQWGDRIKYGHNEFERKSGGCHAKRRAKKWARTRGHNKTQARR